MNLTMPLTAWLGLSDQPGEAAGLGALDAGTCRDLADMLAGQPAARWCVTLTGPGGQAVAHGCASAGPPPRRTDHAGQRPAGSRAAGSRAAGRQPGRREPPAGRPRQAVGRRDRRAAGSRAAGSRAASPGWPRSRSAAWKPESGPVLTPGKPAATGHQPHCGT